MKGGILYKILQTIYQKVFQAIQQCQPFQNEYFQNILFLLWLMKNPFLNTDNYAVVRQFNRLKTKERSISDLGLSSSSSSYSPSMKYTDFSSFKPKNVQKNFNRGQKEYLVRKKQKQLCVQHLRAQIFGIEEFRYHPSYFQQISNQNYKYCQRDKSRHQKVKFPGNNNHLTSKKSLKNSQHQILYQSVKKVQILQQPKYEEQKKQDYQFQQPNYIQQQIKNEGSSKSCAKNKYRSSGPQRQYNLRQTNTMIQSMLSIKMNKNQEIRTNKYSSSNRLQSRKQVVEKNPKIIRSTKKKCSLFERLRNSEQSEPQSQNENENYKISVSKVDSQVHYHMQQINLIDEVVEEKSLKSSNFQTTGTKVSTNDDDSRDPCYLVNPPVIYVRNKIFYINQVRKRKWKAEFY